MWCFRDHYASRKKSDIITEELDQSCQSRYNRRVCSFNSRPFFERKKVSRDSIRPEESRAGTTEASDDQTTTKSPIIILSLFHHLPLVTSFQISQVTSTDQASGILEVP